MFSMRSKFNPILINLKHPHTCSYMYHTHNSQGTTHDSQDTTHKVVMLTNTSMQKTWSNKEYSHVVQRSIVRGVLSGGFCPGGFVRGALSGGLCPGGLCPRIGS